MAAAGLLFVCLVWFVSVLPVVTGMTFTLFLNTGNDVHPLHFSLSNIRYLLIAQFAIVMFIVTVAFGIGKQMALVKTTQVGGKEQNILVSNDEQPWAIQERYDVLKTELLKHSEIESVTAAINGKPLADNLTAGCTTTNETQNL